MENYHTLYDEPVWNIFIQPGEVVEVRIPSASGKLFTNDFIRNRTVSGYFDEHKAFRKWVQEADKNLQHNGIYFSLQVIDPRLIARSFNRLKATQLTTSDNNVLFYRWMLIDCDPERPAGISSSDEELQEALRIRDEVCHWLITEMSFPNPMKAMSGNGGHALFRLPDLSVNSENKAFIKGILDTLGDRFDSNIVKIDRTVFNPSRIVKLYGTKTGKGDEVPDGQYRDARPHRLAYIETLGDENENDKQ